MGRNMEKYCLKWSDFEANIRESFKTLREEERLFDVTLVTDDGQHIQAHKMVLSAGSHFFSDIFTKTNPPNMLIYLKGISSAELEPATDFLYNGEAFITQEYLATFLVTAKELQIKGLLVDLEGLGENAKETQKTTEQSEEKGSASENFENMAGEVGNLDPLEELVASFDSGEATLVKTDNSRTAMNNKDVELDFQIKE